ncbi:MULTISPECIES: hypothetical protein [Rhodococcus]|uniref:hypothetical protein n=1 Tax=Rhodococcus TaxID=1827 RepID=UPI002955358A|nr:MULTISPECIES: hypothetical protein [Rhodococcus]MDV7244515.1 hypothetical protein [Rhodococcus oxybenzonivorans]MDV7274242.1 hypothetical protein [Rhodococcus oxybenzonivorans]MDV7337872.1 hypothetical protein [Rhodococcus oxybenzonivorans]MDV7345192.1 hypothetical protein [Rhodococcus oxybenzonivorans]MDV8028881.1 hypothetical protein [Rhodococcus sp. IEGM 27]
MILYECTECGFGIGGSHPETAENEYELRQEIDAHEEVHRPEDDAAALLDERDGRARGDEQVVSCAVVGEGHDDTHALALGESLEQLAGRIESGLADVVSDAIEYDAGHDAPPPSVGGSVNDAYLRRLAEQGLAVLPSRSEPKPLTRDDVRAIVREELVVLLRVALAGGESLVKFVEPLGHGVDHLFGGGGSRVVRREGMEGLVDRLHSGERVRNRVDSASEIIKSSVGCHPVSPLSVDSGVTTVCEDASSTTIPPDGGESR